MFKKFLVVIYVSLMLVCTMRVVQGSEGISAGYICGDYLTTEVFPRTNWFNVTNNSAEQVYLSWEVISGGSVVDRGAFIFAPGDSGLVLGPGGFNITLNVYQNDSLVSSVISGTAKCAGGNEFIQNIEAGVAVPVNPVPEEPMMFCGHTSVNEYACEISVPSQNPIPDPVVFGCAVPLTVTAETPLYWLPEHPTDAILQPGTTLGGGVLENGWYDVMWVGQRLFLPANVVQANGLVCIGD